MKRQQQNAPTSAQQLRSYVDRTVRLKEQIRELQQDVKDIAAEAASSGFDRKALGQMVKETMMDEQQRAAQRELEEICEVYRASLGMLRGTPLGDAARRRAADKGASEPVEPNDGEDSAEGVEASADDTPPEPPMPLEDMEAAREKGREAGRAGVKIFGNPYVAGDPRRAAWDEGHCEASGTDGMEIPPSWRRRPKRQPGAGDEGRAP